MRVTGGRLHFAGVSCGDSPLTVAVRTSLANEGRDDRVTVAVNAAHLLCTDAALRGFDPAGRVDPPFRADSDRDLLAERATAPHRDGFSVDAVSSGHRPDPGLLDPVDLLAAPPGFEAFETTFPAAFTRLAPDRLPRLIALLTAGPAGVLGRPPPTLEPGTPADLAVLDPAAGWVCDPDELAVPVARTPAGGEDAAGPRHPHAARRADRVRERAIPNRRGVRGPVVGRRRGRDDDARPVPAAQRSPMPALPLRLVSGAACVAGCVSLAGCGSEAYERDMARNTVPYFELRQELDANLGPLWSKRGVTFRPPRGFTEVAPPAPLSAEDEEAGLDPPVDRRQPTFLNFGLPGLLGAWTGPAGKVGEPAGERWLYAFDTAGLEDDPVTEGLDPEEMLPELLDRFARGFDAVPPPLDALRAETYPTPARRFVDPVRFEVLDRPLSGLIGDVPHRLELYAYRTGSRETVLVLLLPEAAFGDASLDGARKLMLQTLTVNAPPRRDPAAAGGTGF